MSFNLVYKKTESQLCLYLMIKNNYHDAEVIAIGFKF